MENLQKVINSNNKKILKNVRMIPNSVIAEIKNNTLQKDMFGIERGILCQNNNWITDKNVSVKHSSNIAAANTQFFSGMKNTKMTQHYLIYLVIEEHIH